MGENARKGFGHDCWGIWGTSYAGGHVIVLGATDRRIRAVASQVPTISGFEQGLRRIPPDAIAGLENAFSEDERAQLRGAPLRRQLIVSADPSVPALYHSKDAIDFYLQPIAPGIWENTVTSRSTRAARMYEPGIWARSRYPRRAKRQRGLFACGVDRCSGCPRPVDAARQFPWRRADPESSER
jgi:hypothetical protein